MKNPNNREAREADGSIRFLGWLLAPQILAGTAAGVVALCATTVASFIGLLHVFNEM